MAWWSPTFSVGERLPTNIQLHAAAVDHPRGKLYYSGGTNAEKEWKIFPHVWQFDVGEPSLVLLHCWNPFCWLPGLLCRTRGGAVLCFAMCRCVYVCVCVCVCLSWYGAFEHLLVKM